MNYKNILNEVNLIIPFSIVFWIFYQWVFLDKYWYTEIFSWTQVLNDTVWTFPFVLWVATVLVLCLFALIRSYKWIEEVRNYFKSWVKKREKAWEIIKFLCWLTVIILSYFCGEDWWRILLVILTLLIYLFYRSGLLKKQVNIGFIFLLVALSHSFHARLILNSSVTLISVIITWLLLFMYWFMFENIFNDLLTEYSKLIKKSVPYILCMFFLFLLLLLKNNDPYVGLYIIDNDIPKNVLYFNDKYILVWWIIDLEKKCVNSNTYEVFPNLNIRLYWLDHWQSWQENQRYSLYKNKEYYLKDCD